MLVEFQARGDELVGGSYLDEYDHIDDNDHYQAVNNCCSHDGRAHNGGPDDRAKDNGAANNRCERVLRELHRGPQCRCGSVASWRSGISVRVGS